MLQITSVPRVLRISLISSMVIGLGSMLGAQAVAGPPAGYYDSVDTSNATTLRQTVHAVIDDHTRLPYTSSSLDTWDVLELADEDPNNASRILDVYRNTSYAKQGGGNSSYNREHTWPKSYGFPNDGSSNYPYTDCHQLFLSNSGYNSSRSNKPFDNCNSGCSQETTVFNNGQGGSGDSNWTSGSGSSTGKWETWSGRRGDVARALFYMDVRYEGGTHGVTGHSEPDLILTDDRSKIETSGGNASVAYMGLLSVLIQWHREDPVDDVERRRNDEVYAGQGNRNPFIDNPDWADCIFDNVCDGSGGGDPPPPPPPPPPGETGTVFINEFHYDDSGSDQGEAVEIAGPAGTDLNGWQIIGYNGNGGVMYKTVDLSGTIPDQEGCMGTLDFSFSGMQNGAPDGLALVDINGNVVEFISYEGTMTASEGPASGMSSTDVGVSESSSTPRGDSLQRTGTGSAPGDFTWSGPSSASRGSVNTGQTFSDTCGGGGGDPPSVDPWVNELHYDNSGSDTGEMVEVAGPAGLDLDGWELVGYNGNGGGAYKTVVLSGTIPDQGSGLGTLSFTFSGLQNGAPDGVALVDPGGTVIQFISYEGTLTASDGPADGDTSSDIGVSESGTTPVGHSLQMTGTGCGAADFTWSSASANTSGSVNTGQSFSCP